MDIPNMNTQMGKKWFIFYTKVRPWLGCLVALYSIVDFVKYVDIYLSFWWLLLSFVASMAALVLGIMIFVKSRGDYVDFVNFVKKVLIFEVCNLAYQQGVQGYINSGFHLGAACLVSIVTLVLGYLLWYRLNIKYFKKRINTSVITVEV